MAPKAKGSCALAKAVSEEDDPGGELFTRTAKCHLAVRVVDGVFTVRDAIYNSHACAL